jgi:hypothetical protein
MTNRKQFSKAGLALALLIVAVGPGRGQAQASPLGGKAGQQPAIADSKFYCNISALSPAERAHQKQLTGKLIAVRKEIVEAPKGYEFQFSPTDISLVELADWVAAEGKCCPFFDFHIDLEERGKLLCLRLTGEEGIKPFIRTEFHVPIK